MSIPHPVPVARRPSRFRRSLFLRFRRNRDGVVAIEFALLALPFIGIIFAILEVALYFWANQVLETMVADASRAVYTGSFQKENPAGANPQPAKLSEIKSKFLDAMCYTTVDGKKEKRPALFDCANAVKIDVRKGADLGRTYPGAISPPDYDAVKKELDTSSWGYQETGAGEVVVVRAVVEFPVFVPIYGPGSLPNGSRLVMATAVFRNEPF